jgi:hypothetical protein
MTFVRLALFPGGTAEHYRAVAEAIGDAPTPPGRLCFAAGPAADGWQIVQVWRTRRELDDFNRAVFLPALRRLGDGGFPAPPRVTDFEPTDVSFGTGAEPCRPGAEPAGRARRTDGTSSGPTAGAPGAGPPA